MASRCAGRWWVLLLPWTFYQHQCAAVDYSVVLQQAFDECIESSAFGISTGQLPDSQMWASSATTKRLASNGRLFQNSAWQSKGNDYTQWLNIDLGGVKLVTSVATQGFRGSGQFVSSYYFYYSNDNSTYIPVVDDLAQPMMFDANINDDMPVRNYFQYPVIARYVRFSPQRWNVQIAMRVEVYGCTYTPSTAMFDGKSAITFDASTPNTLFTVQDFAHFRFKTNNPQGVLFYASGNQGDYIGLELVGGLMYLSMSLGGSYDRSNTKVGSRAVVGSLLDDNQWHDVQFYRTEKNVTIWVDRVPVNVTMTGNFYRLDLDRFLWLGGVQTFYQPGLTAVSNFTGCIENFVWNGIYMSRDAKAGLQRFGTSGNVFFGCQMSATDAISFPTQQASVQVTPKTTLSTSSLNIAFEFRTYDSDTAVLSSVLGRDGYVRLFVNPLGNIQYELRVTSQAMIIRDFARNDKNSGLYTDGLWHKLVFTVQTNKVNLTVDGKTYLTDAQMNPGIISTVTLGGNVASKPGFLGCMRNVFVNGDKVDFSPPPSGYDGPTSISTGILLDTCAIDDRCNPNPCENGGVCLQNYFGFSCNCGATGYIGSTCHQPKYKASCSRIFELTNYQGSTDAMIDVDGSGGLAPFPVKCVQIQTTGEIETHVNHDTMDEMLVNGYQAPGSYIRNVNYVTNITQLDQLVYRASVCRQYISYRCKSSRLLQNPGSQSYDPTQNVGGRGQASIQQYEAWGWWFGRNYQNNYYWGGAAPGTHKCQCGLTKSCLANQPACNCDAALAQEGVTDEGFLNTKEHLPVLTLRFGDTGSLDDSKEGYHKLGPLICVGDSLFDKPVTFRKQDALIYFTTFWSRDVQQISSWDIGFRFKTTAETGIFVNQVGTEDFVEVRLVSATSLSFRFSGGYGVQAITITTSFQLNDNNWHQVYAERNRQESLLVVDELNPNSIDHPVNVAYRPFYFTSPMVIGAGVDYSDGYVGCMSSLQNNGQILNLYEQVSSGAFTYGLSLGCTGKCDSSPCLNGGICHEYYYMFYCDCSYTPFRGLICGREVGVSLYDTQMLIYRIPVDGGIDTDSENITIGFITRKKPQLLLQVGDRYGEATPPNNYITLEINNEGGIRVSFVLAVDRYQINSKYLADNGIDLTNGQPHIVQFTRANRGTLFTLKIDDYPPTVSDYSSVFPQGSDTRLDNVQFIVMGRNFTGSGSDMSTFVGCLFRVQFDNNWPLKRIYQDPRPANVMVLPSFDSIREDKCGFEEILPPREPEEVRPTLEPPATVATVEGQQALADQNSGVNSAIIGVLLGVVAVILIVIVAVFIWKCRREREKNYEYEDDEDEDNLELEDIQQPMLSSDYYATPGSSSRQYAGTPAGSRHSSAASESSDGGGKKKDEWFI